MPVRSRTVRIGAAVLAFVVCCLVVVSGTGGAFAAALVPQAADGNSDGRALGGSGGTTVNVLPPAIDAITAVVTPAGTPVSHAQAGDQLVFTVTITNVTHTSHPALADLPPGSAPLRHALTDSLGLTYTCDADWITIGESTVCRSSKYTATTDDELAGVIANDAVVESFNQSWPEAVLTNEVEFAPVLLGSAPTAGADLRVTKSADTATVKPGDTVTYTITVVNESTTAATGVVLRDALPAEVTYVSATAGEYEAATRTAIRTVGVLAPGRSASFTVTVQVNEGATPGSVVVNRVVADQDLGCASDADLQCAGEAEVQVSEPEAAATVAPTTTASPTTAASPTANAKLPNAAASTTDATAAAPTGNLAATGTDGLPVLTVIALVSLLAGVAALYYTRRAKA